ncbi:MAG: hypothetical protein P4L46_04575 [Fimbriimonas sp.]|nr:hypothetical protein [Fimbriimonas sp.]
MPAPNGKTMSPNYPSASQAIRNIADLKVAYAVVHTDGRFRVFQFEAPYVNGSEFWVVNEKGFLWEAAVDLAGAFGYLSSDEAVEYQQGS